MCPWSTIRYYDFSVQTQNKWGAQVFLGGQRMKLNYKLGTTNFIFRLLFTSLDIATTRLIISSREKRNKRSMMVGRKWWWYSDLLLKLHNGPRSFPSSLFFFFHMKSFQILKFSFTRSFIGTMRFINNHFAFTQIHPWNYVMRLYIFACHW